MLIEGFLALAMLVFVAIAVFSRRMLYSAAFLGLSSVVLAVIFFHLGAPFAAGFELSIGAGMISLLFIVAISLSGSSRESS